MMIMHRTISLLLLFVLLAIGCRDAKSKKSTVASSSNVKEQAQTYAKEWANMGMWLPNTEQVGFFTANIDDTKGVLVDKLSDANEDVRQRAAYVIEKIGPAAKPMQMALVTALAKEQVPLVRIYLCNALSATGEASDEALS